MKAKIIVFITFIFVVSAGCNNYEINNDYKANYLWLEGCFTLCTLMENMQNPNDELMQIDHKFFRDFTKNKKSQVLKEINNVSKIYTLKRLDYGYLTCNDNWEIRGVIAVFEYDPTIELRYVFCLDSNDYFQIPKESQTRERNIEFATKKMLEKKLDIQRNFIVYKYLLKIEGEFVPHEKFFPSYKDSTDK